MNTWLPLVGWKALFLLLSVQVRFFTIYTRKKVSGFIYLWFLFGDWNKSGI
jgi:hypothetical protein